MNSRKVLRWALALIFFVETLASAVSFSLDPTVFYVSPGSKTTGEVHWTLGNEPEYCTTFPTATVLKNDIASGPFLVSSKADDRHDWDYPIPGETISYGNPAPLGNSQLFGFTFKGTDDYQRWAGDYSITYQFSLQSWHLNQKGTNKLQTLKEAGLKPSDFIGWDRTYYETSPGQGQPAATATETFTITVHVSAPEGTSTCGLLALGLLALGCFGGKTGCTHRKNSMG